MLSTILSIGGCVALIAGVAYFFFQYAPMLVTYFNDGVSIVWEVSETLPEWLKPIVPLALALCAISLIVKLL